MAVVKILLHKGESFNARILIDQESKISLITKRLRLLRNHSRLLIVEIREKPNKTKGQTSFTLKPCYNSEFKCTVFAHILPKITDFIPLLVVENQGWTCLNELQLTDPNYLSPGPVDILVGDTYRKITDKDLIKGPLNTPVA